jgi:methylated-DNA-[protein]-cysteine S-methyltransferase
MKFKPDTVQARCDSPLGPMTLAASAAGVSGIWFEGDPHRPDTSAWPTAPHHPLLRQTARQLLDYFAGSRRDFALPLDLDSGTPFQQAVWRALLQLPYGATTSYGAMSARIGKPKAVRALGGAVGRNPLSIVVPCHRVLGASGALTGYAGGLPRKIALLRLEGVDVKLNTPGEFVS